MTNEITQPVSRQVRRALERRTNKPEPGEVERTSTRHLRRTKGLPFSRTVLADMTPGVPGRPAILFLKHPTRSTGVQMRRATHDLVDLFFPSVPATFRSNLLGY